MPKQNSLSLRLNDPYLLREKEKYQNPIPSREWILKILTDKDSPILYDELSRLLAIDPAEDIAFYHRLRAMVKAGQIYINRHKMISITDITQLVQCRVEGHKDGFGFAVPIDTIGEPDFALNEEIMRTLMHGDIINVRATSYNKRGKREGYVVNIVARRHKELVVRLYTEKDLLMAVPEDRRICQTILLPNDNVMDVATGKVAIVGIDHYPNNTNSTIGHIKEILGNYADPGMEITIAVHKHNLPYIFSEETLQEVAKIPVNISHTEIQKRRDIRHLPLVTIDGETAKDFDDAVYAEKKDHAYRLLVAIADVSHYVVPNSATDKDAYTRGTSVYFPRRVIPMLPEKLSNDLCSLIPKQDRLCMVCDMHINLLGVIETYKFYQAIIRSHARLTYTQVWQHLSTGGHYAFKKELGVLYALYQVLAKQRTKRGAIEFDGLQTQMMFDQHNKIKIIVPEIRNDAHRMIEECMLAANVCAANFILKHQKDSLFRIHEGPSPEKLHILKNQLNLLGLSLRNYNDPKPMDYATLINQLEGKHNKELVQMMLLRSLQQAAYQPKNNLGHFGLAYEAYVHFTSPIRRYPDLCTHRSIKGILAHTSYRPKQSWGEIAIQCSSTERRAEEATRDVEKWLKTYYMRDKIGDIFEGTISHLTNFGVFVMLKAVYVEGMIHITDLGQDYFHYIPEQLSMVGERTKARFTMGESVLVKVVQANLDTCQIDLVLAPPNSRLPVSQ